MTAYSNDEECYAAGLDPREVQRIASGLARWAKKADRLGLTIFGGAGNGSLRAYDGKERRLVVCSSLGLNFDGGDGAEMADENGLMRGE